MNPLRLLRTVRHLPPRQIAALMRHRVRGALEDPARVLSWPIPPWPGSTLQPNKPFLPPLQVHSAESLGSGYLTFLNQPHTVGWPPAWDSAGVSRLWLYNLHYFDWLWSLDFETALPVVLDWIDHHPPQRSAVGWEPYPISLRLLNWSTYFFGPPQKKLENQPAARDKVWASIVRQASWLEGHLETHLSGNHVLENAVALCVAGCCFAGAEARRWRQTGLELLRQVMNEQFLTDGGHYERSPMYHSRAMYVLLLLDNLADDEISRLVKPTLAKGIEALKAMTHPDGRIALLNDSAWGIYNPPAELAAASGATWPPPTGVFALPDTGYYGARTEDGSYVVCDAGPIGPDHQPGHAHGDTLSFELSLRGHRVIVDSGVYDYEPGEMRDYCRSTRGHNAVEVDGQDQCEFWGTFRVGRRSRVSEVNFVERPDGFELSAGQEGYRHARTFGWSNDGTLRLVDRVRSKQRFVSRLHLHPDCSVLEQSASHARVRYPGGVMDVRYEGAGGLAVEESHFCPEFGKKLANRALAWSGESRGEAKFACTISSES